MPISLISSAGPVYSSLNLGDTSGAKLLVVFSSWQHSNNSTFPSVSDSKGNTWIHRAERVVTLTGGLSGFFAGLRMSYVVDPIVGASHTVTVSGHDYGNCSAAAFSGIFAFDGDQTPNATVGGGNTTIQPGSVTPAKNGSLIVSAVALTDYSGMSLAVDSGLAKIGNILTGSEQWKPQIGWLEQAAAAAINPTWTASPNFDDPYGYGVRAIAYQAAFEPAAGRVPFRQMMQPFLAR